MIDNPSLVVELLEPGTLEMGSLDSLSEAATVSLAISMKRIADTLEGVITCGYGAIKVRKV